MSNESLPACSTDMTTTLHSSKALKVFLQTS